MILFMVIILLLSVTSVYYLNLLSKKNSAILKENYRSIAYAREMATMLNRINLEIVICAAQNSYSDTNMIKKAMGNFQDMLLQEKNNITEIGEDTLVNSIEAKFNDYCKEIAFPITSGEHTERLIAIQNNYIILYHALTKLSTINEEAVERKTNEAKISAKKAFLRMSGIASLCFLIAYAFTFSFSSYFNNQFKELVEGVKEIAGTNYRHRLSFTGNDEISEISTIINEMADKIVKRQEKEQIGNKTKGNVNYEDVEALKNVLVQIKDIEQKAVQIISKFENTR